jgi:hypothetical protein
MDATATIGTRVGFPVPMEVILTVGNGRVRKQGYA